MQHPPKEGTLENWSFHVQVTPLLVLLTSHPLFPSERVGPASLKDLDFQVKSQNVTPVMTLCYVTLHLRGLGEKTCGWPWRSNCCDGNCLWRASAPWQETAHGLWALRASVL